MQISAVELSLIAMDAAGEVGCAYPINSFKSTVHACVI